MFFFINLIVFTERGNLNLDISLRNTNIYYLSYKTLSMCLDYVFCVSKSGVFFFFFFFCRRFSFYPTKCTIEYYLCTVHILFMGPTTTLFRKKIKNGSYGTIHTFKNYIATMFLVFNFQQNKLYPNEPLVYNVGHH